MRYLVLSMLTLSLSTLSAGQSVSKPVEPVKTTPKTLPEQTVTPDSTTRSTPNSTSGSTTSQTYQDGQTTTERKMVMPDEVDQYDTTDIFAIPFDTSEVEEDIEIENLDRISDRLQAQKAERLKQQAAKNAQSNVQSKVIDSNSNPVSE